MRASRRLIVAFAGLFGITAMGTLGYMAVEGMAALDALYMTVITMSTVGYGEVAPLTAFGKVFTIVLILTTVGMALYFLGVLSQTFEVRLEDLLRGKSMENKIEELRNHVIVVGFGRFGRVVADELIEHEVPLVIIERDAEHQADLERLDQPFLVASALSDDVLERAGIERARSIVIGTGSDADNVFIALSARERRPDIRIHARGESDASIRRLKLAGADQVISAYQMGAQRVAASILRPSVVDFLEIARPRRGAAIDLEEVRVQGRSSLVGRTVAWIEAHTHRLRVVALKRGDEAIQLIPDEDTEIADGDHLVMIGETESLADLAQRAIGPAGT